MSEGWQFGSLLKNQFIIPVPAQMRTPEETWYQGTADAIYQNINLIEQADPHVVAIFGADHIYRMNVTNMIEYHEHEARASSRSRPFRFPRRGRREFGVIEAAPDGRIIGFHEKSAESPTIPGDPTALLRVDGQLRLLDPLAAARALRRRRQSRQHARFRPRHSAVAGRDAAEMFAYDFQTNQIPGEPPGAPAYWRDGGARKIARLAAAVVSFSTFWIRRSISRTFSR